MRWILRKSPKKSQQCFLLTKRGGNPKCQTELFSPFLPRGNPSVVLSFNIRDWGPFSSFLLLLRVGRGGGTRDIKSAGERRRGGGGGYQSQGAINYKKKEEERKSSKLGSYSYFFPRSQESLLQYFFSPKERLYDKLAGSLFGLFFLWVDHFQENRPFSPRLNPSKAFFFLLVQAYNRRPEPHGLPKKGGGRGGKGSESN